jgi:hypothetical protein
MAVLVTDMSMVSIYMLTLIHPASIYTILFLNEKSCFKTLHLIPLNTFSEIHRAWCALHRLFSRKWQKRTGVSSMHTEDDSDDLHIAAEIALTRSNWAQANAAALAFDSTLTKATVVVLPAPKQPVNVPEAQPEPKRAPQTVTQAKTAYISLDATLADQPELDLARGFLHYNFPIPLPPHYQPSTISAPDGNMVVVGEKVIKGGHRVFIE